MVTKAMEHLRQFICGLHGHDALLHFGPGRMSLHCPSCGYESPGWEVGRTTDRTARDANRRVVSMPLVRERRAA
jgi:hypothetical protein